MHILEDPELGWQRPAEHAVIEDKRFHCNGPAWGDRSSLRHSRNKRVKSTSKLIVTQVERRQPPKLSELGRQATREWRPRKERAHLASGLDRRVVFGARVGADEICAGKFQLLDCTTQSSGLISRNACPRPGRRADRVD